MNPATYIIYTLSVCYFISEHLLLSFVLITWTQTLKCQMAYSVSVFIRTWPWDIPHFRARWCQIGVLLWVTEGSPSFIHPLIWSIPLCEGEQIYFHFMQVINFTIDKLQTWSQSWHVWLDYLLCASEWPRGDSGYYIILLHYVAHVKHASILHQDGDGGVKSQPSAETKVM